METIIILAAAAIVILLAASKTRVGKIVSLRVRGSVEEAINNDAGTVDGAKAHYNNAIQAKAEACNKAAQTLGAMRGKADTYARQLRDYQKDRMQYDISLKAALKSGDDNTARQCLEKMDEIDENIRILKETVDELDNNIRLQEELVATLTKDRNDLVAERDRTILSLETSKDVMSLRVDPGIAMTDEDKMLDKVRDGARRARERAIGHKAAYESSDAVQRQRLAKQTRAATIDDRLKKLKEQHGN